MLRTKALALAVALSALLTASQARAALTLTSNYSTITDLGGVFDFDFSGQTAPITANHKLVGIRVDYTYNLPSVEGLEQMTLTADLLIPGIGDSQDFKLGYDLVATLADGSITSFSEKGTNSPSGLFYSQFIKDQLLDDEHISAALGTFGPNSATHNQYFNPGGGNIGGTLSAKMTLTFVTDRDQGTGVPEPASMLVWSALGAGYMVRRRMKKS